MKILFLKITTIIASLLGFFTMGRKSGINKINNKINEEVLEDIKECREVDKKVDSLSDDELYNFMFPKNKK